MADSTVHVTYVCTYFSTCRVEDTVKRFEDLQKKLAELEEAVEESGGVKEKIADLHKRFQEAATWKAGKVRTSLVR